MTCLLPVVAAIVLAADPAQGLFLGIPPEPADPVIENVAPPECLFYLNWAGTRAPDASSDSETEKLLAEPDVQEFLKAISKVITVWLKQQDEEEPGDAGSVYSSDALIAQAATTSPPQVTLGEETSPQAPAEGDAPTPTIILPSHNASPGDRAAAAVKEAATELDFSYQEGGELAHLLLTRPMAVFLADVKVTKTEPDDEEEAEEEENSVDWEDAEIQGGLVISLGPDGPRWRDKLHKLAEQARKNEPDSLERFQRDGETWYRTPPTEPGDKNRVTFGFHGNYFVVAVGEGTLDGMLARWNGSRPSWLTKAMADAAVPRRTGITYLNVKMIRDKLLPLADDPKEALAGLELLGLDNADSIVATTGLDDYGMIGRTLLALDGKPHGLLDLVSDRPLTAADLEPIPDNALLALAGRVDLNRSLSVLLSVAEKAAELEGSEAEEFKENLKEALEEFKKENGVDLRRLLSAVGDTWCVYNSPTEGEIAFFGWTAVVSVRDRAALVEGWEKLCAASSKSKKDDEMDFDSLSFEGPLEFRKCRCAGHDVYYIARQAIAPAFCITDREMVMTLNMPAMKAYLARKDHRSLATLPVVAAALKDGRGPVGLWYCDSPKLFDFYYPLISLYGTAAAGVAQEAGIDLEPTYWPSAPAIRAHLRPDVTTVERTAAGLQVTSRYSLPSFGVGELLWLSILSAIGDNDITSSLPELGFAPEPLGEPAEGTTFPPPIVIVPEADSTPSLDSAEPASP